MIEAVWDQGFKRSYRKRIRKQHLEALKETEQRRNEGKETVVDWGDAKKELRKRFE